MKKGFTLVELSIVLVIIGLLIGGILVGQSMIATANVQAAVKQLQGFDAAVVNFQTKFRQLPGDANLMDPAGDNDGNIGNCGGGYIYFEGGASCELGFWVHLHQSGFTQNMQSFILTAADTVDINSLNPNSPKFKLGTNSAIAVDYTSCNSLLGNCYRIGKMVSVVNPGIFQSSGDIAAKDVLALDLKIDDGKANAGIMRGGWLTCASGAKYQPQSSDKCQISIKVAAQSN